MPIPRKQVPIDLNPATPTALTVDVLKKQLTSIGLTCPDAEEAKLSEYVSEVKGQLPAGQTQTYAILQPAVPALALGGEPPPFRELAAAAQETGMTSRLAATLADSSVGNWEPDPVGDGYGPELEYIQYETHFDWLKTNRTSFTGTIDNPPAYSGMYATVDAVKNLFLEVGTAASATLIKGLDKDSIESVLSNAIAPLSDADASNYDVTDSRVIFLVDNYDPVSKNADGIGVLTIWWHLTIQDYKKKSKDATQHNTQLTIKSRAVLYSSLDDLYGDYNAAKAQFGEGPRQGVQLPPGAQLPTAIPPKPAAVKIFDKLPPANAATFSNALPTVATTDHLQAIVLYAPDLENIGAIDNTTSDATTTYSRSVTSGFTFSTTQTLSAQLAIEVSFEVVKATVTVGFSISFTEEWNSSKTTTIGFSVPPAKKAFTYQGYLLSAVIDFNANTGTYSYLPDTGRFVTDILTTSNVPLTGPPTFTQLA